MINKKFLSGTIFIFGIFIFISFISAYTESYVYGSQYNNAMGLGVFSGSQSLKVDESMCQQGTDFLIQIGSCSPAPVSSDLLEEENVNVFCKLNAIKINPLVDVKSIDQISFVKEYPKEIAAIGYHPAQSALGYYTQSLVDLGSEYSNLEGFLALDNLGYVVITLKRQPNESALTNCEKAAGGLSEICWVEGNLTARLRYDIENAFGVGNAVFYLPEMDDEDWENNFVKYSFWGGRGYLRAEAVGEDSASITIYSDKSVTTSLSRAGKDYALSKYRTKTLMTGEKSEKIFLPGISPCLASLQLTLHDVEYPDTRARIKINEDYFDIAEDEYFLDNKCRVLSMDKNGVNSEVQIRCEADEVNDRKNFYLRVFPKVTLKIDDDESTYNVGDWLYRTEDGKKSVYLGYVGGLGETEKGTNLYAYLVAIPEYHKDKLSDSQLDSISAYAETVRSSIDTGIESFDVIAKAASATAATIGKGTKRVMNGWEYHLVPYQTEGSFSYITVIDREVLLRGYASELNEEGILPLSNKNYTDAMSDFETVVNSYPEEKEKANSIETFGLQARREEIILASSVGKKKTLIDLCDKFERDYPKEYNYLYMYCEDEVMLSNSGVNTREITINGIVKEISFDEIIEPSVEDYSAVLVVEGPIATERYVLRKNQPVYLTGLRWKENEEDLKTIEYVILEELEDDSAKIRLNLEGRGESLGDYVKDWVSKDSIYLQKNIYEKKGVYKFTITDINFKKVAKVSVQANTDLARSNSSFSFKIGIEKRAIQLAPDQIRDRIDWLNDSLAKVTKASDALDGVVTTWKFTCGAVGGWLVLKNMYINRGGKAEARQEVMTAAGGWNDWCEEKIPEEYDSIDECFLENAEEIEENVDALYDIMREQKFNIAELEEMSDTEKEFNDQYSSQVSDELKSVAGEEGLKDLDIVTEVLDSNGWEEGIYTTEQLEKIELYSKYLQENPGDEAAIQRLNSVLSDVEVNSRRYLEEKTFEETVGMPVIIGEYGKSPSSEQIIMGAEERVQFKDSPYKKMNIEGTIPDTSYVSPYKSLFLISPETHMAREFFVVYDSEGAVTHTYEVFRTGTQTPVAKLYFDSKKEEVKTNPFDLSFKVYDKTLFENEYLSSYGASEPLIRYHETAPYKGLPAVVPFDRVNGWYAGIQNPAVSYDASARLTKFYLCNVGYNGREEFQLDNFGDDVCQLFSLNTEQKYTEFQGLSKTETMNLITRAQRAVESAQRARARQEGLSSLRIDGWGTSKAIKVGAPLESLTAQCTDFMPVKDCVTLFNVCDPVICPSSRCDFGGKYPVQNVIQSGIVGGLVLCYPNAKWEGGDVYVPFCLSGINAGLKNLISMGEAYRDCLQTSLDTGETIGICDEIHSIYLCQLLWKESIPVIKLFGERLIDKISGKSAKGGGEYQGLSSALKNAQDSVDFFKQYYAAESYRAFQLRSTEQIGTELCGTFISAVVPGGDFFDFLGNLVTPDVPFQFTGKFEETQLTTATNPPTSHYKVWFHIYAGEDSGAYYTVYLRGSGSSYYQDTAQNRNVKSGYIAKGNYADETIDFTAPSGYNQMCIVVNGQEECGFKEVSTSFTVNYLSDLYLAEQAKQTDIKTTDECVSGTLSLYSLLDLNAQSAAENLLNPELYNQGITRVCSTENPGLGTDANANTENSNWKQVGYCDNTRIGCWLNMQSVEDAIRALNLEEGVIDEVDENSLEYLSGEFLDQGTFASKLEEIKSEGITDLKKIELINAILNLVYFNNQKANLYFLRGKSYSNLAINDYSVLKALEEEKENIDPSDSLNSQYTSPIFRFGETFPLFGPDVCYRFYDSKWHWATSCGNTNSISWIEVTKLEYQDGNDIKEMTIETTRNFIISLQGKDYFAGLDLLMRRTMNSGPELIAKDDKETYSTEMANNEIFTLDLHTAALLSDVSEMYYKYSNGAWQWSPDKKNWMTADKIFVNGGKYDGEKPNQGNIDIINLLKEKTFYEGVSILFDPFSSIAKQISEYVEEEITNQEFKESEYVSPKFEFEDGTSTSNLCYKYFNSEWYWTSSCDSVEEDASIGSAGYGTISLSFSSSWIKVTKLENEFGVVPTTKNEEFIKSLQGRSYIEGLKLLVDRTKAGKAGEGGGILSVEPDLVTDKSNMDEKGLFTVDLGRSTPKLYYKFVSGAWQWSSDNKNWMKTDIYTINGGKDDGEQPSQANIELIKSLTGKTFYEGAAILFDPDSLTIRGISESGTSSTTCTSSQTKCEGTIYFICVNNAWVSQGQVDGQCGYSSTSTLSALRTKILTSAEKFEGVIVPGDYNIHCSEAVSYVYKDASAGLFTSPCLYSAKSGQQYNIVTSSGTYTITMGTIFMTANSCQYTSDNLAYTDMLKKISPGDRIDLVFDEDSPHGVIFINWVAGKEYQTARIFDWNGVRIYERAKDSLGNTCTENDFFSTTYKYCKSYQYTTYDLSINKHPVYRIWNPVAV